MTDNVLITGGCGFAGRHITEAYADRGDDVTVLDIGATSYRDDVKFVDIDIRDQAAVEQACEGQDLVIHNASVVHTKQNQKQAVWDINHGGTKNILSGCKKHKVPRLMYISSASVVYDGGDIENGDETLPYPSTSQAPYADSKIASEKLLLAENCAELVTCSLRPHVIFGPYDRRFLPAVLARVESKRNYGVGKGDKLSDFTYVGNLVDATVAATDLMTPGSDVAGQAYFITNAEPESFFSFANRILTELGHPTIEKNVPRWLAYGAATVLETLDTLRGGTLGVETGMTRFAIRYMCTHHYFDISKAKRDLNWEPKVNLAEGIKLTVAALPG